MRFLKIFFLLFLIVPIIYSVNVISISAEDCSDYEFIFARGSGQKLNDIDFTAFKNSVIEGVKEDISFYELGQSKNGYPAKSVDFNTALGAFVSAGNSYSYGESVERGVTELISRVKNETKRCKDKRFIISGYSQGAQVVDEGIKYLNSDKIIYVANFGDPKLYLPEGGTKNACKNIGLSSYRVYVPDCNVEEGILSANKPYQPAGYNNKLGVWCNKGDIVCGSSLSILDPLGGHTSYVRNENTYKKLAKIIKQKIERANAYELLPTKYSESQPKDVAVIFDYQQFSSDYNRKNTLTIDEGLKNKLVELTEHGVRVAVYNSYAVFDVTRIAEKVIDFTTDNLEDKINELNRVNSTSRSIGVNNMYNNNYSAIKYVSKNAEWLPGHERNIIVITNTASELSVSTDGSTEEDAIKVANDNNVKVSFVSFDGEIQNSGYINISKETGGEPIGNDYSKIKLSKNVSGKINNYFSKTYDINQNSEYTLVVINGAVYGISNNKTITILDLDNTRENEIIFLGFNKNGNRVIKETHTIKIPEEKIKAPDTSGT